MWNSFRIGRKKTSGNTFSRNFIAIFGVSAIRIFGDSAGSLLPVSAARKSIAGCRRPGWKYVFGVRRAIISKNFVKLLVAL